MKPAFSILVASYNYARFLPETLDSLLAQSFKDFEVLVIDDGSKDNSLEVIKEYAGKDSRIRLLQHDGGVNKGLIATVRLGLQEANAEWIAFLESDDYWREDYLQQKFEYIQKNPGVGIVVNDVKMFGPEFKGSPLEKTIRRLEKYQRPGDAFTDLFYVNILPTFSAVTVRTNLLRDCNWNPVQPALLDWWLWRQIAFVSNIGFIDQKLTFWRQHPTSYLKNHKEKNKSFSHLFFKENNALLSAVNRGRLYQCWVKAFCKNYIIRKKITKKNRLLIKVLNIPVFSWKLK